MENSYNLEKTIWSEADFEKMCWHDVHVHGISFGPMSEENGTADFLFDIDYLFEWIKPIAPEIFYSFWIAPCTLVFENAYDFKMQIEDKIGFAFGPFVIEDFSMAENLERDGVHYGYRWKIKLRTGWIELKSYGLKQYVRQKPRVGGQWLLFEERAGVNYQKKYSGS